MFGSGGENRNDHGDSSDSMPPNGSVIEVFEEVNSKGVNQTYTDVHSASDRRSSILQDLPWLIKTAAYTPIVVLLSGTKLVSIVATVDMKVAHAKLWECLISILRNLKSSGKCITNLIPVVTATWPRRLNQPQIHEVNGALLGVESTAAQKYGPPLVGWALQISEKNQHG